MIIQSFDRHTERQASMSLLALPTELRSEIYRCLPPDVCYDEQIYIAPAAGQNKFKCQVKASQPEHLCFDALLPKGMVWNYPERGDYNNLLMTCRIIYTELKLIVKNFDIVFHLPEMVLRKVRNYSYLARYDGCSNPQLWLPWRSCNAIRSELTQDSVYSIWYLREFWFQLWCCHRLAFYLLEVCAPTHFIKQFSLLIRNPDPVKS